MTASIDIVKSLYTAFAAGNIPAFLGRLDPKVVWNEAESFAYADRNPYVGPEAIVTGVFQRIMTDFDGFQVVVGEIVGGPEVVTMFGRYAGKSHATGRALDVQCAHTWWIRDGKIVRFQQMVDTARAASTMR